MSRAGIVIAWALCWFGIAAGDFLLWFCCWGSFRCRRGGRQQ